jgi:hypothetical protein
MTADLFSLAGFGGILIGFIAVGALIFCVSSSAEDPSDPSGFSGFLRHKQIKADDIASSRRKQP